MIVESRILFEIKNNVTNAFKIMRNKQKNKKGEFIMKKILATVLLFTLLLALVGCQISLVTQEPNDSQKSGQQLEFPPDFAIHFESWIDDNRRNILDTYKGYIQKDLIMDGVAKREYTPSYDEICQLYQFVISLENKTELDFSKSVTYNNYANDELFMHITPLCQYYLKFTANGKIFEITGDYTATECTDKSEEALLFIQAITGIGNFYENTKVYKSLPESDGGYD